MKMGVELQPEQTFVTAFLFSNDRSQVALIKKLLPEKHFGLLNGIGGKVETGETIHQATSREVKEEAGVHIKSHLWKHYLTLVRLKKYRIHFFFVFSDLVYQVSSMEQEEVNLYNVDPLPSSIVPNLKWLIPLCLDQELSFPQAISIYEP